MGAAATLSLVAARVHGHGSDVKQEHNAALPSRTECMRQLSGKAFSCRGQPGLCAAGTTCIEQEGAESDWLPEFRKPLRRFAVAGET